MRRADLLMRKGPVPLFKRFSLLAQLTSGEDFYGQLAIRFLSNQLLEYIGSLVDLASNSLMVSEAQCLNIQSPG
jgi:hypothetical protein